MKLNPTLAYKQGSTTFNAPGKYPLKFNYVYQDITDVSKNNQDVLEKLYIEFATIAGSVSLNIGCFLYNVESNILNPNGTPNGEFATDINVQVNALSPIDTAYFTLGTDNIYRGYVDIIQTHIEEDLGMLLTIGTGGSITGLNIGFTNSVKHNIM